MIFFCERKVEARLRAVASDDLLDFEGITMASREQNQIMQEWRGKTGWEFMGWDRIKSDDPKGFIQAWDYNVKWVMDNLNEADSIIAEYRRKHEF